ALAWFARGIRRDRVGSRRTPTVRVAGEREAQHMGAARRTQRAGARGRRPSLRSRPGPLRRVAWTSWRVEISGRPTYGGDARRVAWRAVGRLLSIRVPDMWIPLGHGRTRPDTMSTPPCG